MRELLKAGPCYGIADLLVSAPAAAAFAPSLGVQTCARMIVQLSERASPSSFFGILKGLWRPYRLQAEVA